ncbi:MAG: hypothetical protein Q7R81_02295, partial [Candidatus Peregrinibacteria bacterium]|nr:hypothetical protein [Candidatus Peregrinibacteria bacterium]
FDVLTCPRRGPKIGEVSARRLPARGTPTEPSSHSSGGSTMALPQTAGFEDDCAEELFDEEREEETDTLLEEEREEEAEALFDVDREEDDEEHARRSAGHCTLVPSHTSTRSQATAAGRQIVPEGFLMSVVGQSTSAPVHLSSSSHTSAAGRHTVDDGSFSLAGQDVELPSHFSSLSHAPAALRHTVVEAANVQLLVQQAPPSHCSPPSFTPLPQVLVGVLPQYEGVHA